MRTGRAMITAALAAASLLTACGGDATDGTAAPTPPSASPGLTPPLAALLTGAATRASDRQAQARVRNAVTTALVYFVDHDGFAGASSEALRTLDGSTDPWVADADSTGPNVVSFAANADRLQVAVLSRSGTCFAIALDGPD
ncbi:MAG: hypothetical protein ACRDKS_00235, partial [Actinomycetota bacterium]